MGATMVRGDRGGEVGGVVVAGEVEVEVGDMEGHEAESGLQESLRRQLEERNKPLDTDGGNQSINRSHTFHCSTAGRCSAR